jgi:4,5-dihydroxyphthalate decarboxylase
MRLQLSIGITSNPRTWPIIDKRIAPAAIDLVPTVLHPSELFWRQLRFAEFDLAEMSLSSLLMAKARGDDRFVGIPVFTTRRFFHTGILVRRAACIEAPADLRGKRVGVPEYQQTAALWARGVLEHEFGVAPKEMEFWMERPPSHSHGGATGFVPPPGVAVHYIPVEKNIGSMMLSGELDAVLLYLADPNLIDRSTADLPSHPDITTLFLDPRAEGVRYFRKTGIYPINHGMVIKRELAEKYPWAILNILTAFNRANDVANSERLAHAAYHIETGMLAPEASKTLATSVVLHGIGANRVVLETIAQYSLEQGLTPRLIPLNEVFAASVMDQ